jgi:hypothetical protein
VWTHVQQQSASHRYASVARRCTQGPIDTLSDPKEQAEVRRWDVATRPKIKHKTKSLRSLQKMADYFLSTLQPIFFFFFALIRCNENATLYGMHFFS